VGEALALLLQRYVQRENRAFAGFTLYYDGARVSFRDPLRDGQTQARSSLRTRASFVCSPEAIEDVREVGRSDADPGVADTESCESIVRAQIAMSGSFRVPL